MADDFAAIDLTSYAAHPDSTNEALLGPHGLGIDVHGQMWVVHYAGGLAVAPGK